MAQVTLSAALRRIKTLKGSIATESQRMVAGVLVIQGQEPAFSFTTARIHRSELVKELLKTEVAVAEANATKKCLNGSLGIDVIRQLQELKSEIALMQSLQSQAKKERTVVNESVDYNYDVDPPRREKKTKTEIYLCELPELAKAAEIELLKKQFEELNNQLETFNHTTLVEV